MSSNLLIKKIEKENIFVDNFKNLTYKNNIEFKHNKHCDGGIAVIYGPNGTGKTSLAKVLSGKETSSEFSVEYGGRTYFSNDKLFHIINDQNGRNIIKGNPEEFLLGDNIRLENELKTYIDESFAHIFKDELQEKLKKQYNITKQGSLLLNLITNASLKDFTANIINNKKNGRDIDKTEFIDKISRLNKIEISQNDELYQSKLKFIKANYVDRNSVIDVLLNINTGEIQKYTSILEIEENTEAVKILEKFKYKEECIVCDNEDFHRENLINRKLSNKENVIKSLDEVTRNILEKIIVMLNDSDDPFNIKNKIIASITEGQIRYIEELKKEIEVYCSYFDNEINNFFYNCLPVDLIKKYTEYMEILQSDPQIEEEDVLFIQKIVSEHIGKEIVIKRDTENDNKFKILLGNAPLLEQERESLHLSNGEQNFISLAFELLKARNCEEKIVILDDPISSFDSIYKNKITYCIIEFLKNKKQLILTHNTDLIKLLHHQVKNCFNFYFFNNVEGENNGFIYADEKELEILLDTSKLMNIFREGILSEVQDERNFIISMIPFIRGYSNIIGETEKYKELSKLMHGYEDEYIEVDKIYKELLNKEIRFSEEHIISTKEICDIDMDDIKILKEDTQYKLLDKALYHNLCYLNLRLRVEKNLIDNFNLNIKKDKFPTLSQIIWNALKDPQNKELRIFFMSRKTLLNEFNHFEGNFNIFQPAIDITDTDLKEEIVKISEYLEKITEEKSEKVIELHRAQNIPDAENEVG